MSNKDPKTIDEQIVLLKERGGMLFKNEELAKHFLLNISYYRLKGYWWDLQSDKVNHIFLPNTYFEDIIDRYNFDRHLRLILFDAIERIEIALRTKMIYFLSQSYGGLWYLDKSLVADENIHNDISRKLKSEFKRSNEIFIKDQIKRFPNSETDVWKILEIASLGTLSKIYKNLNHQLPEKSLVAKSMGLNLHSELSSWLESITYVRNIIAHHSRLWNSTMVKKPVFKLNNPIDNWLTQEILPVQSKKPFLIISSMIYLCNTVTPNHQIKHKILELFTNNPNIPIYKMGFLNNWEDELIWKI